MKRHLSISLAIIGAVIIGVNFCAAGTRTDTVEIRIPTAEEEGRFLLYVMGRLKFYNENGYTAGLPQDTSIQKWIKMAKDGKKLDEEKFLADFKKDVFKAEDYAHSEKRLQEHQRDIEKVAQAVTRTLKSFKGKIYPKYQVVLTLYGPGGNYDPDSGVIHLKTYPDGLPKKPNPISTIAHEIVHIGIEEPIVEKFELAHFEKERLADIICAYALKGVVPYDIDWTLNRPIDSYVSAGNIANLQAAMKKYIKDYPRSN